MIVEDLTHLTKERQARSFHSFNLTYPQGLSKLLLNNGEPHGIWNAHASGIE